METTQLVGLFAAVFTTVANIPQTYIIIRERSTEHISVTTYGILFLGTSLWVIYGIIKKDWPIIAANSISTLISLIIIILNFTSQKTINKVHETIIPEKVKKEIKKSAKSKSEIRSKS